MRVAIDNKIGVTMSSDIKELNKWWQESISEIYKNDRLINNVEIDGNIFYSDYENYIVENYKTIHDIRINTLSKSESIYETLLTMQEYLERFVPEALKIADYFYGSLSDSQWNEFSELILGIDWILKSIDFMKILYNHNDPSIQIHLEFFNKFAPYVQELESSISHEDYTNTGDIIQYEIVPLIEQYKVNILKDVEAKQ